MADTGVSLEPPKRAKRKRRQPVKLSPSSTPKRTPRVKAKPREVPDDEEEPQKSESSDIEEVFLTSKLIFNLVRVSQLRAIYSIIQTISKSSLRTGK